MSYDDYVDFIRSTRLNKGVEKELSVDTIEMWIALPNEVGELLDHFKKHLRDGKALDELEVKLELGDVLYSIIAIIDNCGYTVDEIINLNVEKLTKRKHKNEIHSTRSRN